MSEARSLPPRPDLRWLRDQAKRRRKAGEFSSLALAQLAVAREYGFRSWPLLKFHVEAVTLDASERAAVLIESVTSSDLRRARALLEGTRARAATTSRARARPARPTRSRAGSPRALKP